MNAMGQGTSTVTATSTMDCTSSAPPSMMYTQPPPTGTMMPGWNAGTDGECQCVCNVDLANGYQSHVAIHAYSSSGVNNLQGINGFGGQLGNVQSNFSIPSTSSNNHSSMGCKRSIRPPSSLIIGRWLSSALRWVRRRGQRELRLQRWRQQRMVRLFRPRFLHPSCCHVGLGHFYSWQRCQRWRRHRRPARNRH